MRVVASKQNFQAVGGGATPVLVPGPGETTPEPKGDSPPAAIGKIQLTDGVIQVRFHSGKRLDSYQLLDNEIIHFSRSFFSC